MTLEQARSFFLWCSIINYAILLWWVVIATIGRKQFVKVMSLFFRVNDEQCELLNIWGMTIYKLGIILFFIVPCIVLYIIK